MVHDWRFRPILAAALLGLTALTACESAIDREMRQEREALRESGELEELEQQLNTVNPDPYPNTRPHVSGRNRKQ